MELQGLVTGVGWHDEKLQLELRYDEAGEEKGLWALEVGKDLSFRLPQARSCIGYRPPGAESLLPCPDEVVSQGRSQCDECFVRAEILPCLRCDGERCRNPARRESCVQPENHALYLCAFAPGVFKVGVARWGRRRERVSEQGARAGMVVARDNGQMIRRWEQMIRRSGVMDRLQPAEKLKALSQPAEEDLLLGGLEELRVSLTRRLPIPWLKDPEHLDLEEIPSFPSPPQLVSPSADFTIKGPILAQAGNLVVVDSDRGQPVAFEATQLVGYQLQPLGEEEETTGQMSLSLV